MYNSNDSSNILSKNDCRIAYAIYSIDMKKAYLTVINYHIDADNYLSQFCPLRKLKRQSVV